MNDSTIISDCLDRRWRISEAIPTRHGWPVFLGRPLREDGTCFRQRATTILTPELRDHLSATVAIPSAVDLPLSPPTVNRLRRMLGLTWREHRRQWWEEREEDLHTLTEDEFAAKHGVTQSAVSRELKKRRRLRRPARRLDDAGLRQLLSLPIPHAELAGILEVRRSTVARWRTKVATLSHAQPPGE
jgi:hypothetical protein